eukprot:CAMPEP_0174263178 /NCGR_PEP_ID=MMETSP0439-20130205/17505_1 /TAXON_ID=0 /ORGANISM="Stereomyxa ramosa, Strain Chinc5" /LENGTH=510 /DNA_ID=CAMNT_0015348373 /DNA_START=322 /DNA_END=1854 /DNA_ORIENTATION=+
MKEETRGANIPRLLIRIDVHNPSVQIAVDQFLYFQKSRYRCVNCDDITSADGVRSMQSDLLLIWPLQQNPKLAIDDVIEVCGEKYYLRSVASHFGMTLLSGHYVALIKYSNCWVEANDSSISIIGAENRVFDKNRRFKYHGGTCTFYVYSKSKPNEYKLIKNETHGNFWNRSSKKNKQNKSAKEQILDAEMYGYMLSSDKGLGHEDKENNMDEFEQVVDPEEGEDEVANKESKDEDKVSKAMMESMESEKLDESGSKKNNLDSEQKQNTNNLEGDKVQMAKKSAKQTEKEKGKGEGEGLVADKKPAKINKTSEEVTQCMKPDVECDDQWILVDHKAKQEADVEIVDKKSEKNSMVVPGTKLEGGKVGKKETEGEDEVANKESEDGDEVSNKAMESTKKMDESMEKKNNLDSEPKTTKSEVAENEVDNLDSDNAWVMMEHEGEREGGISMGAARMEVDESEDNPSTSGEATSMEVDPNTNPEPTPQVGDDMQTVQSSENMEVEDKVASGIH